MCKYAYVHVYDWKKFVACNIWMRIYSIFLGFSTNNSRKQIAFDTLTIDLQQQHSNAFTNNAGNNKTFFHQNPAYATLSFRSGTLINTSKV